MNNQEEIWKDIKDCEGFYQVSTLGRVKSLKFNKVKYLKYYKTTGGYLCVEISVNNVRKKYKIHQLVAMAFLNHIPSGMSMVVDHINGVRDDNRLLNLQLISQRENVVRAIRNDCTSIYTGVCLARKARWMASIRINGKKIHLGYRDTEIEAHELYQEALLKYNKKQLN